MKYHYLCWDCDAYFLLHQDGELYCQHCVCGGEWLDDHCEESKYQVKPSYLISDYDYKIYTGIIIHSNSSCTSWYYRGQFIPADSQEEFEAYIKCLAFE